MVRVKERRRGEALEGAILVSAWDELLASGYAGFTFENVAKRAATSRPVLARRWKSRAEIAVAAMRYYLQSHQLDVPNTGSVGGDLVTLLHQTSRRSCVVNGVLFSMRDYFSETGSSLSGLMKRLAIDLKNSDALETILKRGIDRGEIDPRKLTKRIASLPVDLVRHETLVTNKPVSVGATREIVETIFLPLVKS
jgi:AcrR family transcriptional regulator